MTHDPTFAEIAGGSEVVHGWRAGAINPPSDQRVLKEIEALELRCATFRHHRELITQLGSQAVHAAPCRVRNSDDCDTALVRFSGAIETAFGFTREVLFFYSPYPDLQYRSFTAAKLSLNHMPREVTQDLIAFWSPDPRAKQKLDDWSTPAFTAVPLPGEMANPIELIMILRDYVFARDLFYEVKPVTGERFFGRRILLKGLLDDIKSQRVVGVFGLRKAGKTSVLAQLKRMLDGDSAASSSTAFLMRDLESLPSPPDDPIPDLLAEIIQDLILRLQQWDADTGPLDQLGASPSQSAFKRAVQAVLKEQQQYGRRIVLALDEIEYLIPSERIDIHEGDMPSVAQFLGVLRSLVQENQNFTFVVSGLTSAMIESGRLYGRPNPLFSWAKPYYISPFTRSEADDLARSLGSRMGVAFESGALEALHEATGGHAFLYRNLASAIVLDLPIQDMSRTMTRAGVLRQLAAWRRDVAGNVKEMLNHVRRYYTSEAFLLDALMEDPAGFNELAAQMPAELGHLLHLGLVEETSANEFAPSPVLLLI